MASTLPPAINNGGDSEAKDRKELKSLQGYFQADLPTILSIDTVLNEFETTKRKADALRKKVERRIKKTSRPMKK